MNIGTITTAGPKGQIVIPQKIRESLKIKEDTPLQIILSGGSISIFPIRDVVRDIDTDSTLDGILKFTQGSWGPMTEEEKQNEKNRQSQEFQKTKQYKKLW